METTTRDEIFRIADQVHAIAEDSKHPFNFGGSATYVGQELENAARDLAALDLPKDLRARRDEIVGQLRLRGSYAQDVKRLDAPWWPPTVHAIARGIVALTTDSDQS